MGDIDLVEHLPARNIAEDGNAVLLARDIGDEVGEELAGHGGISECVLPLPVTFLACGETRARRPCPFALHTEVENRLHAFCLCFGQRLERRAKIGAIHTRPPVPEVSLEVGVGERCRIGAEGVCAGCGLIVAPVRVEACCRSAHELQDQHERRRGEVGRCGMKMNAEKSHGLRQPFTFVLSGAASGRQFTPGSGICSYRFLS